MVNAQAALQPLDLRLRREDALLLLIDIQERLAAAMPEEMLARLRRNALALVEGARQMGIPVQVTEQYPRGLGRTLEDLRAALPPGVSPVEKIDFSCLAVPSLAGALAQGGRRQVIACGMETHVCVYQTVRDLIGAGYRAFVPQDAVASRAEANLRVGLSLMERAGAVITSTEAALFDLLGRAGSAEFKAVSALIR